LEYNSPLVNKPSVFFRVAFNVAGYFKVASNIDIVFYRLFGFALAFVVVWLTFSDSSPPARAHRFHSG
jgi:hypothetical protein